MEYNHGNPRVVPPRNATPPRKLQALLRDYETLTVRHPMAGYFPGEVHAKGTRVPLDSHLECIDPFIVNLLRSAFWQAQIPRQKKPGILLRLGS